MSITYSRHTALSRTALAAVSLLASCALANTLTVQKGQHISEEDKTYTDSSDKIINILADGSYTGNRITITNNGGWMGVYGSYAQYVKLTNSHLFFENPDRSSTGVYLFRTRQLSVIDHTTFSYSGVSGHGDSGVFLTDSDITITNSRFIFDGSASYRYGITAGSGSGVSISDTSFSFLDGNPNEHRVFSASSADSPAQTSITAQRVTIDTPFNNGLIIESDQGASVTLKDSTVISRRGSVLARVVQGYDINGVNGHNGSVTLDNVDLSQAKGQKIVTTAMNYDGTYSSTITLTNNTHFDGRLERQLYAAAPEEVVFVILDIQNSSSWTISGINTTHLLEFSLDGTSCVNFMSSRDGGFYNIYSAAVMLEANSILRLDQDASSYSAGDVVTLFNDGKLAIDNKGAILLSQDGYQLVYDESLSVNGSFVLTGEIITIIPEPASASLGLLGLASMALRRSRRR